jgi:hypothetical protein
MRGYSHGGKMALSYGQAGMIRIPPDDRDLSAALVAGQISE